jgi:hypothetical protein
MGGFEPTGGNSLDPSSPRPKSEVASGREPRHATAGLGNDQVGDDDHPLPYAGRPAEGA